MMNLRIAVIKCILIVCCWVPLHAYAQNWDARSVQSINAGRNSSMDPIMVGFSNSIYPISIGVPLVEMGIGYFKQDDRIFTNGVSTLGAVSIAYVTAKVLKVGFNRDRPFTVYPSINNYFSPTDGSLPSGHTSGAFAIATSLSIHYPHWYVVVPAYAWASTVGYARMYLGVHYPSDVLLGAVVGTGAAYAAHYLNHWIKGKYDYSHRLRIISNYKDL